MSIEAMKQALDKAVPSILSPRWVMIPDEDFTTLRTAIEAAEKQEPVGYIDHRIHGWPDCIVQTAEPPHTSPLYTTPQQREWVGLTDEQIEKGRDQTFSINNPYCPCDSKTMRKAVRWAEAKLKEKNT